MLPRRKEPKSIETMGMGGGDPLACPLNIGSCAAQIKAPSAVRPRRRASTRQPGRRCYCRREADIPRRWRPSVTMADASACMLVLAICLARAIVRWRHQNAAVQILIAVSRIRNTHRSGSLTIAPHQRRAARSAPHELEVAAKEMPHSLKAGIGADLLER